MLDPVPEAALHRPRPGRPHRLLQRNPPARGVGRARRRATTPGLRRVLAAPTAARPSSTPDRGVVGGHPSPHRRRRPRRWRGRRGRRDLDPGATVLGGSSLRFDERPNVACSGEIAADLASPLPMHRLLQGDVGSGKTVVALTALLAVDRRRATGRADGADRGARRAASRLAAQGPRGSDEGRRLASWVGNVPCRSNCSRDDCARRIVKRCSTDCATGAVDIVVGTHALLTDDVRFRALGVIVIDEQHRFGVEQRAALRDKGRERSDEAADPDLLVMTATPIPRTAAMVVFGDLDRSVLDEMPQGRLPIETFWATEPLEVAGCWQRVRDEVALGDAPTSSVRLVEDSEKVEATSAVEERTRLSPRRTARTRGRAAPRSDEGTGEGRGDGPVPRRANSTCWSRRSSSKWGSTFPKRPSSSSRTPGVSVSPNCTNSAGRVGRSDVQSYCYLLGHAPE